jgi:phosphatidylglycerophosphate synthase
MSGDTRERAVHLDWRTKPTDRFVLRWIKRHLSARITPGLAAVPWVRPWMVTLAAAAAGIVSGALFAGGQGGLAGLCAALSQVLDGVDGQLARLAARERPSGAFLDSVMDRYGDTAMIVGLVVYGLRWADPEARGWVVAVGFLALSGSGLISYTTARAGELGILLGAPTLASKGTRTTAMAAGGVGSLLWPWLPVAVVVYLAAHTNAVVLWRLARAHGMTGAGGGGRERTR